MICKNFAIEIEKYIDGELEESEAKEIEEHKDKCEDCRSVYEELLHLHNELEQIFIEKDVPIYFEKRIINNLPEPKFKKSFMEVLFMKKALVLFLPIIVVIGLVSMLKNLNLSMEKKADIAALIRVGNVTYYHSFQEVITDDGVIEKEIGVIEKEINERSMLDENSPWASSFLMKGTKVYSIKGLDQGEVIAAKDINGWVICRSVDKQIRSFPIFTEDMLQAEKITVQLDQSKKEITDKEVIKKVALALKEGQKIDSSPSFYDGKMYTFYFNIKDSEGIGKIVFRYTLTFQEINFDGFIVFPGSYKVSSEINKLITAPFGNIGSSYDEGLGGKQQIYKVDMYLPKIIFRKFIKADTDSKFEVKLINEGEDIWKDGRLIKDNLKGRFKLQVIMKDTTLQKSVIEDLRNNYSKLTDAVSIDFTEGASKDTTVMYLGFNMKPEYQTDEFADSFLLLINYK